MMLLRWISHIFHEFNWIEFHEFNPPMGLASWRNLFYFKAYFLVAEGGLLWDRGVAFVFHVLLSMHCSDAPFPAEKPTQQI